MRYQVWVWTSQAAVGDGSHWRPVSRPFDGENDAQNWALDLADWCIGRTEIRKVE